MSHGTPLIERKVGAELFLGIDLIKFLAAGETIASVAWASDDLALATLVSSSDAISDDGKEASAKFNHLAAGVVRITATVTTTNPVEILPVWVLVRQSDPPETG